MTIENVYHEEKVATSVYVVAEVEINNRLVINIEAYIRKILS